MIKMGKKILKSNLIILFVTAVIFMLAACGGTTVIIPSPTPVNTPTSAPLPSDTPLPTDTPMPTDTPAPTNTSTPTPVPEYTVTDIDRATYVSTDSLNVRKGPSTKYEIIGKLKKGERVTATGKCSNGWYRIEYDGKEAFASGTYLLTESQYIQKYPTPTPNPYDSLDQTITQYAGFSGEAFAIIDIKTGKILYSQNADAQLYPASLTKMMTGLLACENLNFKDVIAYPEAAGRWQYETSFIEAGRVTEVIKGGESAQSVYGLDNDMTTLSDAHSKFAGGSYIVPFGTEFTVDEMVHILMMMSAADMAESLAWTMGGGSLQNFNDMMNARAKELGMNNTYFDNAVGADNLGKNQEYKKQNLYYMEQGNITTTAYDMALLARAVMNNSLMREVVSTAKYTITGRAGLKSLTISNGVRPVSDTKTYHSDYFTAIGIKTGYTDWAGNCLALAGKNSKGEELAVIYLKNKDTSNPRGNTAQQSMRLLEYAFRKMQE